MLKTKLSAKDKKLSRIIHQKVKEFYYAGLKGNTPRMFPNLTADTTAEEESQMIDLYIDKYCEESGYGTPELKLRKAMQLINKMYIDSYRNGLSKGSLVR